MQIQDCRNAVNLCLSASIVIIDLDDIVAHPGVHRCYSSNGIDQHQVFITRVRQSLMTREFIRVDLCSAYMRTGYI